MRGTGNATSKVTPVALESTGDYIGNDLRDQYFDLDEIRTFEDMWKRAPEPVAVAEAATGYPQEPNVPPEIDDTLYDDDIPF